MGTHSINFVCRTRCYSLWSSSFLIYIYDVSLFIWFLRITWAVFPHSIFEFSPVPHAGQLANYSVGFLIMETRAMFALPPALLSSQTTESVELPPPHLHMCIVKKYCCRCPIQPVKDETVPDQMKCVCLRAFRLVAEASQVTIQVLSIDLKRWRKAGIKDGMQFVSAKWVLFSVSVV